jgi:hypothetical protein
MSEEFKIEIVNPEKSFLVKEDVSELLYLLLKVKWVYLKITFLLSHF